MLAHEVRRPHVSEGSPPRAVGVDRRQVCGASLPLVRVVVSSDMKLIITRALVPKTSDADGVETATYEVSDYYSHLWVRDLNETMLEVISAVYDSHLPLDDPAL